MSEFQLNLQKHVNISSVFLM